MSSYFIYYTEANVVCLILFGIMLFRDLLSVDRQEKQIKYDHALVAFMLYFINDTLWAAVIAGVIPATRPAVVLINFANYALMAGITYTWLRYVMAVEQVPKRDDRLNIFAIKFPFYVATIALAATYLLRPGALLDAQLRPTRNYSAFQIAVPCVYIAATGLYTLRRAMHEEDPIERRRHLFVGLFPLMVVAGGLVQILVLPDTPVFCFCCAILMLAFYIDSQDTRISTDPLTGLNNRGQLIHYITQKVNLRREGRRTFVVMLDVNDFKAVNDTYGHAEGDRALVLVADALRNALRGHVAPTFAARYGGDEFILIVHPVDAGEVDALIAELRAQIDALCRARATPYALTVGVGCAELAGEGDTFPKCMQRADEKLYIDKAAMKKRR